jgi:hypothetical protein
MSTTVSALASFSYHGVGSEIAIGLLVSALSAAIAAVTPGSGLVVTTSEKKVMCSRSRLMS